MLVIRTFLNYRTDVGGMYVAGRRVDKQFYGGITMSEEIFGTIFEFYA